MVALRLRSLSVRNVRNLAHVDLAFGPRFNVISGDNGQGKTALLESIYLVLTSKSFRTNKLAEIVMHGTRVGSVRAVVAEGEEEREQSVGLEGARRHVLLGGKRPPSLAAYATRSPVVVFHPSEMGLSSGPALRRRMLLDRLGLFVNQTHLDHLQRYATSMRSRQRILQKRGADAPELSAFERLMAEHGCSVARIRERAASQVAPEAARAFAQITKGVRQIAVRYRPGGPMDVPSLEQAIREVRERDRVRGAATIGPHRDDLGLDLDGHDARTDASQGEHRAITLALKAAELTSIEAARGVFPVLLLDDVSSELDVERTRHLFELLGETPGQVFLTTTRRELIETDRVPGTDRLDFGVVAGVVDR